MKNTWLFLVVFCLFSCKKPETTSANEWKLIWSDEFSTDGKPDNTKWSFAGRNKSDWCAYCNDDLSTTEVKDGKLYLRGIVNPNATDAEKYLTGCIQSKGKFFFKYGKMEVCAKLAKGKGSWPAIWLMPEKSVYGGWPKSGEIDVMEQLNFETFFYQTIHSDYIDNLKQKENPKYYTTVPYHVDEFNIFGLEWYPDRIDLFINGQKTFTYPKIDNNGSSQWPFDQEFYIILNQALGGNWPGPVNPDDLPVEMEVDWVKVYQLTNN